MAPAALHLEDSPELRKARGAFFTPPEVADYIVRWAIRTPADRVLEPSCGEAEFLMSAALLQQELGELPADPSRLHGVELHGPSAATARMLLAEAGFGAEIAEGDFFEAQLRRDYSAVVGNPPYVRYQGFTGSARAKGQEAALAAGVRLSGLASSWAPFTIHSANLLAPDGRLGLVLPAELLTVNYAAPVRRFLLERFGSVRLVMFDERVFPGVLAEVVLLLAEGNGGTDCIEVSQARNLADLGGPPTIRWSPPIPEAKWSPALLPSGAADIYATIATGAEFTTLDSWGRTDLGMVSGNNGFFCLTAKRAAELGLGEAELLRISPPGSRHIRGLALGEKSWAELRDDDRAVYLFAPATEPSAAARAYIEAGEAGGVHEAYKCRVRSPWWHVPRVPAPDLFFTYMNADTPRMVANDAGVAYLNSIHGVRLHPGMRRFGRSMLPFSSINSLTILGAELVGRSYGGGILKLEPKEADLLPVPSRDLLSTVADRVKSLQPHIAQRLRAGDVLGAAAMVDRVVLCEGAGLRQNELAELRDARALLFGRRVSRGRG